MTSSNISLGTYVQDGVRSGPIYGNRIVNNNSGIVFSNSHDAYGYGVLFSAQNTWNIVPAAFNPDGGFTSLNNVVGPTNAVNITEATNLALRADNRVTFLRNGVLQFDWPRMVTVTVTNAVTGNLTISIVGTDWYGMPLQQDYAINEEGTYPTITLGGAGNGTIEEPAQAKAFYTVNQVYISGAMGEGSTISLGASDVFGLPYRVKDFGDIIAIGWDDGSELKVHQAGDTLTTAGLFVPADTTTPATAITGDVRGLYGPSSISDGVKRLRFTCYVQGADTWINQVANVQQLYQINNPTLPLQGVAQPPLTLSDLYGVAQFYNGPII